MRAAEVSAGSARPGPARSAAPSRRPGGGRPPQASLPARLARSTPGGGSGAGGAGGSEWRRPRPAKRVAEPLARPGLAPSAGPAPAGAERAGAAPRPPRGPAWAPSVRRTLLFGAELPGAAGGAHPCPAADPCSAGAAGQQGSSRGTRWQKFSCSTRLGRAPGAPALQQSSVDEVVGRLLSVLGLPWI